MLTLDSTLCCLWLIPNLKFLWHVNILSASCTFKCLPNILSAEAYLAFEPDFCHGVVGRDVVQPPSVHSLCRSSSALGANHYQCWSGLSYLFCESCALCYSKILQIFFKKIFYFMDTSKMKPSYSAHLHCRLRYVAFLCATDFPHQQFLNMLRKSFSILVQPGQDCWAGAVQISVLCVVSFLCWCTLYMSSDYSPRSEWCGPLQSNLQPPGTKLTCGTWLYFLL